MIPVRVAPGCSSGTAKGAPAAAARARFLSRLNSLARRAVLYALTVVAMLLPTVVFPVAAGAQTATWVQSRIVSLGGHVPIGTVAKVGTSLTPVGIAVNVAGMIGWELFGDDITRFVIDKWNDAEAYIRWGDTLGTWHAAPPETVPSTMGSGFGGTFTVQAMPSTVTIEGTTAPSVSVPVRYRSRCLSKFGVPFWGGWQTTSFTVSNTVWGTDPNSGRLALQASPDCNTSTPIEGRPTPITAYVDVVQVEQTGAYDNGPAGRTIEWEAPDVKVRGYTTTTCKHWTTGATATGTTPYVEWDAGENFDVPREGCADILPGSYPIEITVKGALAVIPEAFWEVLYHWELDPAKELDFKPELDPSKTTPITEQTDEETGAKRCLWGTKVVASTSCDVAGIGPAPTPTGPTTGPTPVPTPPPSTAPTPPPIGTGPEADPEGKAQNCISGAFTLNPVDWVYVPVKCALTWAFGIKPATQARTAVTLDRVGDVPPFSILTAVPDWLAPIGTLGQACPDWSVALAGESYSVVCDQGYTKRMHDNRLLFGAAMALAMVMPLTWRIWRASIPVLKVQ